MPRPALIASALMTLLASSAGQATASLITERYTGIVTGDMSSDPGDPLSGVPYVFTPGEAIVVEVSYDLDDEVASGGEYVLDEGGFSIGFQTSTGGAGGGKGYAFLTLDPGSGRAIHVLFNPPGGYSIALNFLGGGDVGTIMYDRQIGLGGEGFQGMIARVTHAPEPSTLAACSVGLALLALARSRRRPL